MIHRANRSFLQRRKNSAYVPIEFRPKHPHPYPDHNKYEFERWFGDNLHDADITGERLYLPIYWTAYHVLHGYGTNQVFINKLQLFVNSLDRTKKYFTICQYDDGPIIDFKDLDIIVCGMSGGRIDYPIPLLCEPPPYKFDVERDLLVSFVGAITHPIRKKLVTTWPLDNKDSLVTSVRHKPIDYYKLMARSKFTLCPRGYGKSSFRIMEAIHYGSIPVYISDEFITPYNYIFPGILVGHESGEQIYHALSNVPFIPDLSIIKPDYTYSGCRERILEYVNEK